MLEFPKYSFEPNIFKTGLSWKIYDLSYNSLKIIKKDELVDLLTNDIFWFDKKIINKYSRTLLLKKLNQKLLKLYKPENIELFWLKDPRKAELTEEEKERYKKENFPKHVWIWLPHWTYKLPKITKQAIFKEIKENVQSLLSTKEYSKEVKKLIYFELEQFYRILKNFSDFWTTDVVEQSKLIPRNQVFLAKYSRWTTDPARKISELPMNKDFYWNILPDSTKSSHIIWWFAHWELHTKIFEFINQSIKKYWWSIFFDRHDTWINDMWKTKKLDKYDTGGFPVISLWTLDWKSANPEIVNYYAERIKHHLWIKPLINIPYKWGYITQKYWRDKRKEIEENWWEKWVCNVIQVEVLKSLYLDEQTQEIDKDRAEWIWIWLARAEIDVGLKFWEDYFKSIKNSTK